MLPQGNGDQRQMLHVLIFQYICADEISTDTLFDSRPLAEQGIPLTHGLTSVHQNKIHNIRIYYF